MKETNFIVLRGKTAKRMRKDGVWYDKRGMPNTEGLIDRREITKTTFKPVDRYEVREDGEWAQVYVGDEEE